MKYASGDSEWCSGEPIPPPNGTRMVSGHLHRAAGPVVHLGDLGDDLVEGRVDEPVELDLHHRAVAAVGQPDGGAHDPGFGQRSVHHPLGPELAPAARR